MTNHNAGLMRLSRDLGAVLDQARMNRPARFKIGDTITTPRGTFEIADVDSTGPRRTYRLRKPGTSTAGGRTKWDEARLTALQEAYSSRA